MVLLVNIWLVMIDVQSMVNAKMVPARVGTGSTASTAHLWAVARIPAATVTGSVRHKE